MQVYLPMSERELIIKMQKENLFFFAFPSNELCNTQKEATNNKTDNFVIWK